MKSYPIICLSAALLLSLSSFAGQFDKIADYVEKAKTVFDYPSGTSIAVVKGNKILYQGTFGYANIEKQVKATNQTSYYIASSTKPFFALATLLKEHEGALSENTSMTSLFPKISFDQIDAGKVTVKHLLTHTMGFDNTGLVWATAYAGVHDYGSRRKLIAKSKPEEEQALGKYEYSNVGYNTLSVWFDQQYPHGWQQELKQTVFSPLKMNHTSAKMSDTNLPGWSVAQPYSFFSDNKNQQLYLSKQDNTMHSAGGMVATAPDIARFVIAQLNEGKVDGKQVFPATVIKKSQQLQVNIEESYGDYERFGYAWGWNLNRYKDQVLHSHFGGFSGTTAHISYMLEKEIGVVILNNDDALYSNKTVSGFLASAIYDILLNDEQDTKEQTVRLDQKHAGEFDKIVSKFDNISQRIAKHRQQRAARKWQLTLPKKDYTGIYRHPLIGEIKVTLDDKNQFHTSWGNMHAIATPYKTPDTFRVELAPGQGRPLKFNLLDNKIESVVFDTMVFSRRELKGHTR